MDSILIVLLAVGFMPVLMLTTYIVADPILRCKILNKVKRNSFYGIVLLGGWGNNAVMMVKNLKKDLLTIGEDVYFIQDRMIFNLNKPSFSELKTLKKYPESVMIQPEKYKRKAIGDGDIRVIGGVPFIEFDKNEMIPVEKSTMKLDQKYRNMLPGKVGATIKTEIAIARAKAYNEGAEQIRKFLLVLVFLTIASVGVGALIYMNINNQANTIQLMANQTNQIYNIIMANATGV